MLQARVFLGLVLGSLFGSTLAGPIAVNGAAAVEKRELPKGFTCGCITECMLACPDIRLCLCPPQPCIPKYLCAVTSTPKPTSTKTTKTTKITLTTKKPTKTTTPPPTTTTYIPPGFTCGCLTECEISCGPNLAACQCLAGQTCLPQYLCKSTTTTPTPTPTKVPGCGPCTNACKLSCPDGSCICPQFCDPAYECP